VTLGRAHPHQHSPHRRIVKEVTLRISNDTVLLGPQETGRRLGEEGLKTCLLRGRDRLGALVPGTWLR